MEFNHDLDVPKPFFIYNSLDNIILYRDFSYMQLFYFYFFQFIIYDVTKITISMPIIILVSFTLDFTVLHNAFL